VLVVVDLSSYSDEKFEEDGKWVRALQVHIMNPFIAIVGTKADIVSKEAAERKMA